VYFDGTNDYVTLGTPSSLVNIGASNFTISCLINPTAVNTSWTGLVYLGRFGQSNGHLGFDPSNNVAGGTGDGSNWQTHQTNYPLSVNTWYNLTMVRNNNFIYFYSNGQQIGSPFSHSYTPATATQYLEIGNGSANEEFNGKISNVQIYNRALSQSEILQNYYEGPIVTSGLTLALDAGNLVSYGGTGTTWKDLTANAFNGTLTNGPTYSSDSGGCIVFDGADDMVRVTRVSPMGTSYEWTTEAWIKWSNVGYTSWMTIIDSGNYSSASNYMMWISSDTPQKVLATYENTGGWQYGTIPLNANTWYHVVITKRAGTSGVQNSPVRFFVNGVFDVQRNYTYTDTSTTNDLGVGLTPTNQSYPMNGKIAQAKVYNRALSDAEVTQNYNAQRGRFGI
jgi:hypothetical protein